MKRENRRRPHILWRAGERVEKGAATAGIRVLDELGNAAVIVVSDPTHDAVVVPLAARQNRRDEVGHYHERARRAVRLVDRPVILEIDPYFPGRAGEEGDDLLPTAMDLLLIPLRAWTSELDDQRRILCPQRAPGVEAPLDIALREQLLVRVPDTLRVAHGCCLR